MIVRKLLLPVLVLLLITVQALPAAAQPPQPMLDDIPALAQGPVDPQNDTSPFGRPDHRVAPAPEAAASPDVAIGQPGLSFRYVQTLGETGVPYPVDTQHLNRPNGLATNSSGAVFVVEEKGLRLLKYDQAGSSLWTVGTPGQPYHDGPYLAYPKDVALDNAGNLWVVIDHAVKQFSPTGTPLQIFPVLSPWAAGSGNDRFRSPSGLAIDSTGRLFVSDSANDRVQVFSLASGSPVYVATIGETGVPGNDATHFDFPAQIALDSNNRLYVADVNNSRVQRCVFTTTWACTTFHGTGSPGSGPNQLNQAFGLGIDASTGVVYIADSGNGRVKRCGTGGSCTVFATGMGWPADAAVGAGGQVLVSDWLKHTIRRFQADGSAQGLFAGVDGVAYTPSSSTFNRPWGVAATPDGGMVLTENAGFRLLKLDAAGQAQWSVGQAGTFGSDATHFGGWSNGPEGNPAVDSSGRIYVPDTGNDRIQVFNADGTFNRTFGRSGNGNAEFDCPAGVAISPVDGQIVVADTCNQRVQVYDRNWVYQLTLGVTDQAGSDDQHFRSPWGVAVDAAGAIYVADAYNYRLQKCMVSGATASCATFAGVTGSFGSDFGRLLPMSVAVDRQGRVFVADPDNARVQVFGPGGAYLTTIGGAWGPAPGQMRGPVGVAVDQHGSVLIADRDNHRILKYAAGVPGWAQVNVNGFGDRDNGIVLSLGSFGGSLYAGTDNKNGAQLWRMNSAGAWSSLTTSGFGDRSNGGINTLLEFNSQLYAGTWNWNAATNASNGGQVWRSPDGVTWQRVVPNGFGDPTNGEVFRFVVFGNHLYASTWSYTGAHGGEIWRSASGNTGDWSRVVTNGFGDAGNFVVGSLAVLTNYLYAGTFNELTGGEIWRTNDGTTWQQVNLDGFGDPDTWAISSMAAFDGYLYVSVRNSLQVWRCRRCNGTDWQPVVQDGFGTPATNKASALEVVGDTLYLVVGNYSTGMEVWRTQDGFEWSQIGFAGFGDSNNRAPYWDNSVLAFDDRLWIGTWNSANGGELWKYLPLRVYMPVMRSG